MLNLGITMIIIIAVVAFFLWIILLNEKDAIGWIFFGIMILAIVSGSLINIGKDALIIKKFAAEVPTTIAAIKGVKIYEFKGKVKVTDNNKIEVPELISRTTMQVGGNMPTEPVKK